MAFLSRFLPALTLSLIILISAVGNAYARAPQVGPAGLIVICNGTGLVKVSGGTGDSEGAFVLLCPECLPSQSAVEHKAFAPLRRDALFAPVVFSKVQPSPASTNAGHGHNARAPPLV